jgi:hypothetical protein
MKKYTFNDRILECRFYDGSDTMPKRCPEPQLWVYESMWAHHAYKDNWQTELEEMKHLGVFDALTEVDVPQSLLCLLFNRYSHWIGIHDKHGNDFVKWLKENYVGYSTNRVKHQRILDCRYYNGEDKSPLDDFDACLWDYERVWVTENPPLLNLSYETKELESMGVISELQGEGTPVGMLALLYNRMLHWGNGSRGTQKSVSNWIRENYQKIPTHRQLRKAKRIPELVSRCHFFHGEKACPYTDKREQEYWFYESFWVNEMSDSYASADGLRHVISQYPKIKAFCVERGLPLSLIGMLISREEHWVGYIDSEDRYIDGLKKYYLKEM